MKRAIVRTLISLAVGVTVLLIALPLALRTSAARDYLARTLSVQVSKILVGELQIGAIDELSLERVVLRDVVVEDQTGRRVVRAGRVEAALNLLALWHGQLVLDTARIDEGWVSLHRSADALAIARVFLPVETGEPAKSASGSPFVLRVRRASLHDVTVVELPLGLTVQRATAVGELSYAGAFRLQVWSAKGEALQGAGPLGQLDVTSGSLRVQKGEPWTLSSTLRRGSDVLSLHASAEWGEGGFQSAKADLAGRVSAAGLWTPGLARSVSPLGAGIDIHANAWLQAGGAQLGLSCQLQTAAGTLTVDAAQDQNSYRARLRSDAFDVLFALGAPSAPAASFDVSLDATPDTSSRLAVRARVHTLRYEELDVAELTLGGVLDPSALSVHTLQLPAITNAGGAVELAVRAGFDGEIEGSLAVRIPRLPSVLAGKAVGPVRAGSIKASARGHLGVNSGALALQASFDLDRVAAFGARMTALHANLDLKGTLSRPVIDARVSGRGLTRGQVQIDALEVSARGSARRYDLTAQARGPNGSADAQFDLSLAEAEQRLHGQAQLSGWGLRPIAITAEEVSVRPDAISLRGVRATAERSFLLADGRVGLSGASDLHVQLHNLNVASIARVLCRSAACATWPTGELSAELRLTGTLQAPDLHLHARASGLALHGTPLGSVQAALALDARHDSLTAELDLTGSAAAELHLKLDGQLAKRAGLEERVRAAHFALALSGNNDLAALSDLWRTLDLGEPLLGKLDYTAQLHGSLEQPEGSFHLNASALSRGGTEPVSGQLTLDLSHERTKLDAGLTDKLGPLASLSADLAAAPLAVLRAAEQDKFYDLAGSYQVRLQERKLSQLPLQTRLTVPATLSLSASLLTRVGAAPEGHLQADGTWLAEAENDPDEVGATCPGFRGATLRLLADSERARVSAQLTGKMEDRQVIHAELAGDLTGVKVDDVAARLAGVAIAVDVQALELAKLPRNCGKIGGSISGHAKAVGLLGPDPKIELAVQGEGIAAADTKAMSLALTAKADRAGARVQMTGRQSKTVTLDAEAQLAWSANGAGKLLIDTQHSSAHVRLVELPLALLLAPSRRVASSAGLVSADIELQGAKGDLDARGKLSIEHASLSLRDPVLRVDKLSGRLRFDPSAVHVEELRLGDQQGSVRLDGTVALRAWQPTRAKLSMSAHDMPLRADAKVVAFADGKLQATASLDQNPRKVQISLAELAIRLNKKQRTDVQQLAANPDITYIGTHEVAVDTAAAAPMIPIEIELIAQQPFWVRRDDLGFQLSPQLLMQVSDAGARLLGTVKVQRGYLNLLGKGFTFQGGELLFDGRAQNDPTISLDAVHDLGNQETVTVRIRNRLSAPSITFSTTVAGARTDAQIMQLLVRGREGSAADTAQAQAAAALAALTSGLIGSLSHHKVGKYIPVLSVETGADSGTRLRAGVEGRELLPAPIRGLVEGMYLEGFVGVRNQGGQAQQTGGVLMELYFPKRIVGGGSWELPNHWTVELTWEP